MMSAPLPRIELTTRALRDLRKLGAAERRRIAAALEELAAGAENLDVKPLAGLSPWLRLRVGDWRVLYRPASEEEARAGGPGWFVAPIINRRELHRATRSLS
jgi:mRNA interferase RelE/StbE